MLGKEKPIHSKKKLNKFSNYPRSIWCFGGVHYSCTTGRSEILPPQLNCSCALQQQRASCQLSGRCQPHRAKGLHSQLSSKTGRNLPISSAQPDVAACNLATDAPKCSHTQKKFAGDTPRVEHPSVLWLFIGL